MESNQQSFWQFSDQLRLHNTNFANLSLNDSIWSINSSGAKRPEERRNFDIRVGGEIKNSGVSSSDLKQKGNSVPDLNSFSNDVWKIDSGMGSSFGTATNPKSVGLNGGFNKGMYFSSSDLKQKGNSVPDLNSFSNDVWKIDSGLGSSFGTATTPKSVGLNGGFNKGIYSKPSNHFYSNFNVNFKGYPKNSNGKGEDEYGHGGKGNKKNKEGKKENINNKDNNGENNKNSVDKRFKTLPPSESLPRNETIGGYIFVCNNDTMEENLRRQLFGLPPRYRDSVRAITPGLPLFLYNYSTHQLHGIYEAASFGGTNIDPTAWEDKKNPGESRFPAQVRVQTRKVCEPLDEDAFRPILHHYDGPKFRLELSVPEALLLMDVLADNDP
ncbi:hypothetical protein Nepgr_028571 [Nepenthes gracilis]|uniref:DCD domain-containing protein n=1 Tax=Nepenthes gracilis TaxID=150966 RepID=A0AAD3Y2I7_NEPGR|nr:hypothetical protein Nepgr_028571 [Nepenthes gracilis]